MGVGKLFRGDGEASRAYLWLPLLCWTLVVAASLALNLAQDRLGLLETARQVARVGYQKDLLYRRWNAGHGGVYVQVRPDSPPNPHLTHVPGRDLTTTQGKPLTLINPAYMLRQVYALNKQEGELRANITSLKPLNPDGAPDPWETRALQAFEQGSQEYSTVETLNNQPYLRLMRPVFVEKVCLGCHQGQNYHVGDVQGGISLAVPLAPLRAAARPYLLGLWGGHLLMWLLGGAGIILGFLRLMENQGLREQADESIIQANEKLKVMVYEAGMHSRQTTLLNEMTDFLQSCSTQKEAHLALAHFLPRLFPEGSGALYVFKESRSFLEAVASWGNCPPAEQIFEPHSCLSLRRGRLHQVTDPRDGLACQHVAAPLTAYVCVPLMAHGETLGVLHLKVEEWAENFQGLENETEGVPDMTRQLARMTAEHLSLALSNLKLRETLAQQAIRDPLTGLFNRRYLEETLERELHRVRRKNTGLGVLMCDLDHFKGFNDNFGHEAGDEVLRAVGVFLKNNIRQEDVACRFGGEEFVLILPEISLDHLRQRGEALRQGVADLQVFYQGQHLGQVTLSLGASLFPEHAVTGEALIRTADDALYSAKKNGRNRLEVAAAVLPLTADPGPALPAAPSPPTAPLPQTEDF